MIHNFRLNVAKLIRLKVDVKYSSFVYQIGDIVPFKRKNGLYVLDITLMVTSSKLNVSDDFIYLFIEFLQLGTDIAYNKMRSLQVNL